MGAKRLSWLLVSAALGITAPAIAAPPPCTEAMIADLPSAGIGFGGPDPAADAFNARNHRPPVLHALFEEPVVRYPFDGRERFGFDLTFAVGPDGKVVCASIKPPYGETGPTLTDERKAFLDAIDGWRFMPYLQDGHPAAVVETLQIDEAEIPVRHVEMPAGDATQVTVTQDNRPQMANYTPYHVELHGDGTAIYTSLDPDDVLGPQTYHVDAKAVQALIDKARDADFWSLPDRFDAPKGSLGDDRSFERINITLGGVTKSLTDHQDLTTGLPKKAQALQEQAFAAANIFFWQRPTPATLEQLKANGFDFHGKSASRLLLQMTQNAEVKDDAVQAMIDLGAPLDAEGENIWEKHRWQNVLEAALGAGRTDLARKVIADGGLTIAGTPDRDKINRAFFNAIMSGQVESVDLVLPFRPDMTYRDDDHPKRRLSVLTWLNDTSTARSAVAQRLIEHGANINATDAEGDTLLHRAGFDPDLVKFLLDHGAHANGIDKQGQTPLSMTIDENSALLLLDHGASPRLGKTAASLRFNITHNHWTRVSAWLIAHGDHDLLIAQPGDD